MNDNFNNNDNNLNENNFNETEQELQQDYSQSQDYYSQQYEQSDYNSVSGVEKAPKKKKGLKIACISAGVVGVAAGGAAIAYNTSDYVENQVKLMMLDADEYYSWVNEEAADEFAASIEESYREYLSQKDKGVSSNVAFRYDISADAKDMLISEMGGGDDMQEFIDIINNANTIEIGVDASVKQNDIMESVYASLNDEKLVSADIAMNMEDLSYYLRVPELTKKWLGINLSEITGTAEGMDLMLGIMNNPEDYLAPADISYLITTYTDVWNSSIKNVKMDKDASVDVGGIKMDYTVLKADITDEELAKFFKNALKKAENDKVIKKLLVETLGVCTEAEYAEMIAEGIEEISADIEEGDFSDETLEMITYVDAEGTVRGMSFGFDEVNVKFVVGKDGDNVAGTLLVEDGGEDILEGSLKAKESGDAYTGELTLELNDGGDNVALSAEFDKLKIVNEDKGYVSGNLILVVPEIDPIELALESDGKSQSIAYNINVDGTDFGKVSLVMSEKDKAEIADVEADGVMMFDEMTDFSDYATEDDVNSFITELFKKLGLSEENSKMIADAAVSEMFGGEEVYYDDEYYGDDYYDDYYEDDFYEDYDFEDYDYDEFYEDYDFEDYDYDEFYEDYDFEDYDYDEFYEDFDYDSYEFDESLFSEDVVIS